MVEKWQSEEFPALKVEAKRTGAVIYFADEAGVFLTFMLAPPRHRSGERRR